MPLEKRIPYYNRELSWMDFNARVLEEATKKDNPLMERLRFLAITSSNLDEFFMVRVAGVKEQVVRNIKAKDPSGLSPEELAKALEEKTHLFMERQYSCLHRSIVPSMKRQNIQFLTVALMDDNQNDYISAYFRKVLFPILTPLAVDSSRPFPLLANKTVNIAVRLKTRDADSDECAEDCFAVVQVPSILPRFLELPSSQGKNYVMLEDIIIANLHELFELHSIEAASVFRLTRNSDLSIDDEADDFIGEVKKSLKKRKRGRPVRLEILSGCDKATKKFLTSMIKIKKNDIYELPGPLDLTFFMKFAGVKHFKELCFQPIVPVSPPADFYGHDDIFAAIREKDRLVFHPYESFDCVVKFIAQASEDENVLAIKQTLYRVSGNSPIIAALIKAAENGKHVTVLVELKARFDEENNINWALKLEKAGCHVIYGLQGLKTHCKIALVVRHEDGEIRRYLHLGTGNYNESTARLYTDLGLFTCDDKFGTDASSLFNVITGYSRPADYNHFVSAPYDMREFFVHMIKQEIKNSKAGLPGGITIKINSLVDPEIISLLYEASKADVSVNLIVRGICCLIPGIEGISDNIKVVSIVGQLLEHSRIFKFENGGHPCVYLGSADLMPRNLDRRVELIFPVEDADLRKRVFDIIDMHLSDNTNARAMHSDKSYSHISKRGKKAFSSQHSFSSDARDRLNALQKFKKDSPLMPILRHE